LKLFSFTVHNTPVNFCLILQAVDISPMYLF
jgi:hypothetical protein